MEQNINLTSTDGFTFSAFQVAPEGIPRGAIVVLQEFFGVNNHIRNMCRRFAEDGYLAIAPAIFDRVERGIDLDYDQAGMDKGRELRAKLNLEHTMLDVQSAISEVQLAGRVCVLGYCWGGSLAFIASARLSGLSCAIGYYGAQIAAHAEEKPKVPVILHFAEHDEYISDQDMQKIKDLRSDVPLHFYPGVHHGFNCDDREFYDRDSATLAQSRSMSFIAEHVDKD